MVMEYGTKMRLFFLLGFFQFLWASTCFIILYVCMGIGMLACLYYRMNKKQREKLMMMAVEKDKEIYQSKIEFFTHMIHEIRTSYLDIGSEKCDEIYGKYRRGYAPAFSY